MQISVQTVIEKMEEELLQLAEQGEKGDERALQEHARTLRNYCDILLSSKAGETKRPAAEPKAAAPAPEAFAIASRRALLARLVLHTGHDSGAAGPSQLSMALRRRQ